MSPFPGQDQARAMRKAWRVHERALEENRQNPDFSVGITASFTAESLVPYVGAALLECGCSPVVHIAPYNQLFQTCLDPRAVFSEEPFPDLLLLLWRIEDLLASELASLSRGDDKALEVALEKTVQLVEAVTSLCGQFEGTVICGVPPFPQSVAAAPEDLRAPVTSSRLHRRVCDAWCDRLSLLERAVLLDLDGFQRSFGALAAFDARKWYLYMQPYTDAFLASVGKGVGRVYAARFRAPRKCLVLDCDNTLWGGIVGEDGIEGVALGDEFPGKAYRDFQQLALSWQRQGVLLALLSKNNEADVWHVFDNHDGMVLRREHIAAWRIGWGPKAQGMAELAEELNIGLDAFVFVDDSAFELEQVRSAHPGVLCIQAPEDPAYLTAAVRCAAPFDRLEVVAEDQDRTVMYARERERRAASMGMDPPTFLESLELRVEAFAIREEHLGRAAQLVNKTNQFNLTTTRRSREQLGALLFSPDWRLYAMRVSDRFGEYGLTGLAIVRCGDAQWELDTFLMSCRVLGRGVESAFLAYIAAEARASGVSQLAGRFVPTDRNSPAADFLPRHGFVGRESHLTADIGEIPGVPRHIRLV